MVAPLVIAGLGLIAAGGLAGAILGKKKPLFAVVCFKGRQVVWKMFDDVKEAEKFQEQLSKQGKGSIIVQKVQAKTGKGHSYESLHPVQSMAPSSRINGLGQTFAIAPPGYWLVKWRAPGSMSDRIETFPYEREAKERESNLNQMQVAVSVSMVPRTKATEKKLTKGGDVIRRSIGSYKPPFDTKEVQEQEMLISTRFPTPERFIRARSGPYPETSMYSDSTPVEVSNFNQTVSSHEWKTSVKTQPVKKDLMNRQPDLLSVDHTLQDPG